MRKYLFNFSVTIFIFKVVQQLRSKTEHILIYYILAINITINQTKKLIKMTLPLLVLLIPNNIFFWFIFKIFQNFYLWNRDEKKPSYVILLHLRFDFLKPC